MSGQPESALRAYVAAFETMSAEAVASWYHLPCMFIASPGVWIVQNADEARGMAVNLIEQARSQGYHRTEVWNLEVKRLAANLASLTGGFRRFDRQDKEISRFGFAYTMREDSGGWKIVAAIAHDLPA